jgi:hypothetical protein
VLLLPIELGILWLSPQYVGLDFHAYEAAAQVGVHAGWSHIYDQGPDREVEKQLVPKQITLRFISPPPVAWLAAAVTPLPYWFAYGVWAAMMLIALAIAFGWSTSYRGLARLVAVGMAITPWWVLHSLYVGQVVPLVAAGVLVAWRLALEERNIAAGIALSLVVLKPQTALIAPMALAAAGRYRAFAAWVVSAAAVTAASVLAIGPHGLAAYAASLNGVPPSSADITLPGTLGLTGAAALLCGALIIGAALITARRVRSAPGIAIALGVLASLLASPYLYENDLCLLGAAGWILWHERPSLWLRASLLTIWMLAIAHLLVGFPSVRQWPLIELTLMVALVTTAWFGLLDHRPAVAATSSKGAADPT